MDECVPIMVNWMLYRGFNATELHENVEEAVAWIEARPEATSYEED